MMPVGVLLIYTRGREEEPPKTLSSHHYSSCVLNPSGWADEGKGQMGEKRSEEKNGNDSLGAGRGHKMAADPKTRKVAAVVHAQTGWEWKCTDLQHTG